jgi:AcrR family transcriptional regulator
MPMNSARLSQGRTNDPEGMRAHLLDVAFAAFTTHGYHSTSVQDLKQQAAVSSGALAHHFPTKRELGLAVLRDRVAQAVEETWIAPVRIATSAAEGVAAVFEAIISGLDAQGFVTGCPLNNLALELSREDGEFGALIDAIFTRWKQAIADKLKADLDAGVIADIDSDEVATLVVATYSGAMAMAKAGQNADPLRICAHQIGLLLGDARRTSNQR